MMAVHHSRQCLFWCSDQRRCDSQALADQPCSLKKKKMNNACLHHIQIDGIGAEYFFYAVHTVVVSYNAVNGTCMSCICMRVLLVPPLGGTHKEYGILRVVSIKLLRSRCLEYLWRIC